MTKVLQFPEERRQRQRMAAALTCAARSLACAANEAKDPETVAALLRATDRYLSQFNDLASERIA